jgi:hypothetical protein
MKKRRSIKTVLFIAIVFTAVFCFLSAVSNLNADRRAEGKAQLEEVLRRTAVSCYAAEGVYPPSLEYMIEHYGIRIDEARYQVDYRVIASNLMPDITVLELDHED